MPKIRLILDTLKQELRKQGVTYRQVAEALELSEGSVKRLFSVHSVTLSRLEQLCDLLNLDVIELIHLMEKNIELTTQLTLAQETELVSDIKLLIMAFSLENKLEFSDIIQIYDISETEGIKLLAKLDRMKLIELQPGNRVKLMIAKNFQWIPNGPIQRFFEQKVQTEFFNSSFDSNGEFRIFISGMFSRSVHAEIVKRIKRLEDDIHEFKLECESLPLDQRFGCSLMMAIRPWEVKLFDQLRREPNTKLF